MEPVNAAIIYYSATGTVHGLAQAAAEGAAKAGAHVRLCKVAEQAPPEAVNANPAWARHLPPGYTDPVQFQSGNPYGTSHVPGDGPPGEVAVQAARYQARRVVDTAAWLKAGRAA